MFCDLVGSTELSERLDPEDLREIIRQYQEATADVIESLGGHVAQYLGDGIMAYFGFPVAKEEDPRRAVLSGLRTISAIKGLNATLQPTYGLEVAVRIGIHTGLVVTGEIGGGGRTEQLALGNAPNVAARVQGLADPDTVMVSAITHDLIRGFFATVALGPKVLKGVADPLDVFRVEGETEARSRFQITVSEGLHPMVGRAKELESLSTYLDQAGDGKGQAVLISADAGVGKSRLVQALKETHGAQFASAMTARCSSYDTNTPLSPLLDLLSRACHWGRQDSESLRLEKLAAGLKDLGIDPAEGVPLFAPLLTLPLTGYEPAALSPAAHRRRALDLLLELVLRSSANGTLVFAVEDLHWVDPSTLEFLNELVDAIADQPVLLVLTSRPSFRLPWPEHAHAHSIQLRRLGHEDTTELIAGVTGGASLPQALVDEILARTDGVPIFVEELTKTLLNSDLLTRTDGGYKMAAGVLPQEIPFTLQDSLAARLDDLGDAKEVTQIASVLGRKFSHDLIEAITDLDAGLVGRHLGKAVEANLIQRTGGGTEAGYYFRHALIQEAAYESLLRARRRELHERVARTLEDRFPAVAAAKPELLAQHCEKGGMVERGVYYFGLAGQRAMGQGAYTEAIRHFERALEGVAKLPESAQRDTQEVELLSALGVGHISTKGYAAEEVQRTYARAQSLCSDMETPPLRVVYGLWVVALASSDRAASLEYDGQFRDYLDRADDEDSYLAVLASLGNSAFWRGDLEQAARDYAGARSKFDPERHKIVTASFGGLGGFYGYSMHSWALWMSGLPDQAWEQHEQNQVLAGQLNEPYTIAETATLGIAIGFGRGEPERVRAAADRVLQLAQEQQFIWLLGAGNVGCGWSRVRTGDSDGLEQLQQGLAIMRATGLKLTIPFYSTFLVDAFLHLEMLDEGLAAVDEAIALSQRGIDSNFACELQRLRGELLVRTGAAPDEIEVCFQRSLEQARQMPALGLELRAATSLARLHATLGTSQGGEILREVYDRIEEGFETEDMRAAASTLREIAS